MGVVYRATDRLTGQIVALKQVASPLHTLQLTPRPALSLHNTNPRLALANEFQTLASLRHPHIINVLDYGFDQSDKPYFTMEYVPDSQTIVKAGQNLPLHTQVSLLIQLLQALVYLHRRHILHRDLKPANVLVHDGQVKVLDFGLSISSGESRGGTSGTLLYMAPEILQGQAASETADLYSVGVIAYELFANQHPFKDPLQIFNQLPDWSALAIPHMLLEVVIQLMEPSPANRYHHAEHVLHDLSAAINKPLPPETAEIRESFLQAATFVGRDAELAHLRQQLEAAQQGQGSGWLIGGESGVGKSRLISELSTLALVKGVLVLRGQGVTGGGLPYQLWRDAVRRLLLTEPVTDVEASVLKEIVPDIGTLLGRAVADAPPVDPRLHQRRLVLAIVSLFRQTDQPILLLLEDLQWASESLEPVRQLLTTISERPILLLGTYRNDERPTLPQELLGTQLISLARLSPIETAELSASMLGESGRQPELVNLLQRETEGNAFFLVEVVRTLAEEAGSLGEIMQMTLPVRVFTQGVQTVINRRLRRIPAWGQQLLKLAAVASRQLDLALLGHLGGPSFNLSAWLTVGQDSAVLNISSDGRWQFAHDKLREGVLVGLAIAEQVILNREVAKAIEAVYAQDLTNYYPALVNHYRLAADSEKERYYAQLAGKTAVSRFAYQDAIPYYSRALELTPVAETAEIYQLLLAREAAHSQLGHREAQSQDLSALMSLAQQTTNPYWQVQILLRYTFYSVIISNYTTGLHYIAQALALSQQHEFLEFEVQSYLSWGDLFVRQSQHQAALEKLEQALSLARMHQFHSHASTTLVFLGNMYWQQANYPAARAAYEESLQLQHSIGDGTKNGSILNDLGIVALAQGDYESAHTYLDEALQNARRVGNSWGESITLGNFAEVLMYKGAYFQAEQLMMETIELSHRINSRQGELNTFCGMGRNAIYQGNAEVAQKYLQQAMQVARFIQAPSGEAEALYSLGWLASDQGDYAAAYNYGEQALRIAQTSNLPPYEGLALTVMGWGMLGQGKTAESLTIFHQAATLRRTVGEKGLLMESLAGLAEVYLQQGDIEQAGLYVEEIIELMNQLKPFTTLDPFRIYLTSYRVLEAAQDLRASQLLATAHQLLQERANQMPDETRRQTYLQNIPSHRALLTHVTHSSN